MRFYFILILLLLFIIQIYSEDYVLFDSADEDASWGILPDGFINPIVGNNSQIKSVSSERHGIVSGILLEFSEINTLSYYLIKPANETHIPNINYLKSLEITIYSNESNLDLGILLEDNSGNIYEIFLGTLNFYEWRTLTAYINKEINDIKLIGINLYNNPERELQVNNRVIYIKQISIDAE